MKKARLATYVIFFTFHLGFLIVALLIDSISPKEAIDPNNFNDLLKLIPFSKYANYIFIVKWVATIGIILVIVDFIIDFWEKKVYKGEINQLRNELNATKAKMFDMQSVYTAKSSEVSASDTNDEESSDRE